MSGLKTLEKIDYSFIGERILYMTHTINNDCIQCGACEAECSNGAISEVEGLYVVDTTKCEDCGDCVDVCPSSAISKQ
jgi:ferredoxin